MDKSMKGVEIMKRKKMLVVATVLAMLFGFAQIAVAIPNHFVSTSSESNTSNDLGYLSAGWFFGIYDFGATDPSSGLNLLFGGQPNYSNANFTVTYETDHYQITVISGFNINASLNIGDSDDFSFYFWNGADPSILANYDTDFSIIGSDLNYGFISTAGGGGVIGADLNPVPNSTPLPGSAIFLFSGIMGLVAFGSRRKLKK